MSGYTGFYEHSVWRDKIFQAGREGDGTMNKTELLDKYARDGESRLLLARVLDQQQRADQRGIPTHTAFLSPAEQAMSADLLMAAAPGQGVLHGGYADAER